MPFKSSWPWPPTLTSAQFLLGKENRLGSSSLPGAGAAKVGRWGVGVGQQTHPGIVQLGQTACRPVSLQAAGTVAWHLPGREPSVLLGVTRLVGREFSGTKGQVLPPPPLRAQTVGVRPASPLHITSQLYCELKSKTETLKTTTHFKEHCKTLTHNTTPEAQATFPPLPAAGHRGAEAPGALHSGGNRPEPPPQPSQGGSVCPGTRAPRSGPAECAPSPRSPSRLPCHSGGVSLGNSDRPGVSGPGERGQGRPR